MSSVPSIQRLAVIGVGLIGGSLARALRAAGEVGEIVGCGRDETDLQRAVELGVVDRFSTDVAEVVAGADMIFVAVPLGAMQEVFAAMQGHVAEGAVITDGGSSKGSVVEAMAAAWGEIPSNFVPGHPIAGTERSGVEASFAELYRNRRIILTPTQQTEPAALERVREMWQAIGSEVVDMSVEHHDAVLAATSHLPHMLAFTLVDTLAAMDDKEEIFRYAAGGFRDFTRIASSHPVMWRDICMNNRDALLEMIAQFQSDLTDLADDIRAGESDRVRQRFERAKTARDGFAVLEEARQNPITKKTS